MDRAEKMREKRTSVAVKLIKMIKIHASENDTLVCVFEGDDAKYYGVRIDSYLGSMKRKNIKCKGKENLITLRSKVESHMELSKANVLYFADKDFDFEDSTFENIYITPCYSVENLYIDSSVLRKILIDELGFCEIEDKDDIGEVIGKYELLVVKVSEKLLVLNSWILCQNEKQKEDNSIKLNLNNHDIKTFIDFDFDNVSVKYNYTSLREAFPTSANISTDELDTAEDIIRASGIVNSSRGKYLLEFFRYFLDMVKEEIRKKDSYLIKKTAKPKLLLTKGNVLSELSQYALTPDCLVSFLKINLNKAV